MTDRKAFEEGMILALVSPPLPHVAKKEPIAYSYNGVRLPGLPEWDKEAYPYAFIRCTNIGSFSEDTKQVRLLILSEMPTSDYNVTFEEAYDCYLTEEAATEAGYDTYGKWIEKNFSSQTGSYLTLQVFWSNFDFFKTDGTLVVAAFEPIPVYE